MTEIIETTDEVFESLNLCDGCLTVPLVVLALSTEEPVAGWDGMLEQLNIKQVVDHIGRQAVTAAGARRLLSEVARRERFAAENAQRRVDELAARRPPVRPGGVPRVEGASPFESLALAAGGVVTPAQEFGLGREKPRFLQEELAAGVRADDEKKRLAAERKKQRLVDEARGKLR